MLSCHGTTPPKRPHLPAYTEAPSRTALHGQASLDRGVTEYPRSAPLAGRFGTPVDLGIEPDCQLPAALQRLIVGSPVRGLVGRRCRLTHVGQLPNWIHVMNPAPDLCNRAVPIDTIGMNSPRLGGL